MSIYKKSPPTCNMLFTAPPSDDNPAWQLSSVVVCSANFFRHALWFASSGRVSNEQIGAKPILKFNDE